MGNRRFNKGHQKRDHLHSQVKKYPHNNQLKYYYLKYRNTITILIRNDKKSYYKTELQKSENNSKSIGEQIGKNKK